MVNACVENELCDLDRQKNILFLNGREDEDEFDDEDLDDDEFDDEDFDDEDEDELEEEEFDEEEDES